MSNSSPFHTPRPVFRDPVSKVSAWELAFIPDGTPRYLSYRNLDDLKKHWDMYRNWTRDKLMIHNRKAANHYCITDYYAMVHDEDMKEFLDDLHEQELSIFTARQRNADGHMAGIFCIAQPTDSMRNAWSSELRRLVKESEEKRKADRMIYIQTDDLEY